MSQSLYKYMHSRFATRMLTDGEIRLGTLYTFRDEERLGSEIGDREEGAITLKKSGFTIIDTKFENSVPPFLKAGISVSGSARLQIVARDGVGRREEDPDCWIYCASERYDPEQMRSLGYDVCVEIFDVEQFFFAISRKFWHRASVFWGAAKCVYRDRSIEHTDYDGTPPAFVKAPKYASQAEVRAIWLPNEGERVTPVTVRARRAVRFCRLFRPGGSRGRQHLGFGDG